ncbi:MAG: DUF4190 domain-containing protein [Oscillospiraceae bacterium]|nr:DUF4190 domain-containing protein [Oscillospiraceae bacterium]
MENLNQTPQPPNGIPVGQTERVDPGKAAQPSGNSQKNGFAVASLVLGLVSLFGICCCVGLVDIITIPLALIFGIIALVKKRHANGLAITGIITSGVSLLILVTTLYIIWPLLPYAQDIVSDYSRLSREQDTVFPAYEQTGELPDYLQKYTDSPFTELFERYDATIYTIMDALLEQYQTRGSLAFEISYWAESSGDSLEMTQSLTDSPESADAAAGFALSP